MLSLGALLLASVAGAGYVYWDNAGHFESTDDAFIEARQFALAPKVSGYVAEVPVTDNQHVETGQVIAEIDPIAITALHWRRQRRRSMPRRRASEHRREITVKEAQVAASASRCSSSRPA